MDYCRILEQAMAVVMEVVVTGVDKEEEMGNLLRLHNQEDLSMELVLIIRIITVAELPSALPPPTSAY